MEIELDRAIARSRQVAEHFAENLEDDEGLCLETRSLLVAVLAAARTCDGVWVAQKSEEVEEIFMKAIAAHEQYAEVRGTPSQYAQRLADRYEKLKSVFVHGRYAKQGKGDAEDTPRAPAGVQTDIPTRRP